MPTIVSGELLRAWERGRPLPPSRRADALLSAADPGLTMREIESLSVGRRDARLFALREALFGRIMPCLVNCPSCSERLELSLDTADLRVTGGDDDHDAPPDALTLEHSGYVLELRPPGGRDLAEIEGAADAAEGRRKLLELCILSARHGDLDVPVAALPDSVTAAAVERMARADPQADCQLDLTCPACGHTWRAPFDILSFLWVEVYAWAQRVFREVHRLASAYGWSEAQILSLSETRRQIYLEILGE